jgi:hypothetical protein
MSLQSRIARIEAVSEAASDRLVTIRAVNDDDADRIIASMRASGDIKDADTVIVTMWRGESADG